MHIASRQATKHRQESSRQLEEGTIIGARSEQICGSQPWKWEAVGAGLVGEFKRSLVPEFPDPKHNLRETNNTLVDI